VINEFKTTDKYTLIQCFNMALYWCDDSYFEYLTDQLFKSSLGNINDISNELKRQIYLYSPIIIIPDIDYVSKQSFLAHWVKVNSRDNIICCSSGNRSYDNIICCSSGNRSYDNNIIT
jgi:hypothetical protein